MITSQYIPTNGIRIFGNSQSKIVTSLYNSNFDMVSLTLSDYGSFLLNNRNSVDSCWESGNIYLADTISNKVKKMSFDGTELFSLQCALPKSISVIQREPQMLVNVVEDRGCWIIDNTDIIRTDNELNIINTITGLTNPEYVISTKNDDGCYIIDANNIFRFDGETNLVGIGNRPSRIIDIRTNSFGELFILTDTLSRLYKYVYNNGSIGNLNTLNIYGYYNGMSLSSFDIDTGNTYQYIYVVGGTEDNYKILKVDRNLNVLNSNIINGEYPWIIRIPQNVTSTSFYILGDNTKYHEFESSSSSSSFSSSSFSSKSSSSLSSDSTIDMSSSSLSTEKMTSSSSSTEKMTSSSSSSTETKTSSSSSSSSEQFGPFVGLVGWWKFEDDQALDYSGYGNDGTLVGSPTFVAGKIGDAISLNADGDYINCGDSAIHDVTSVSISSWIYQTGAGLKNAIIAIKQNITGTTGAAYGLIAGGGGGFALGYVSMSVATVDQAWADFKSTNPFTLNEWHFVVGTYSSGSVKIYIDGQFDSESIAHTGNLITANGNLLIGHEDTWENETFRGYLDDVRVYNRELTASEILHMYNRDT